MPSKKRALKPQTLSVLAHPQSLLILVLFVIVLAAILYAFASQTSFLSNAANPSWYSYTFTGDVVLESDPDQTFVRQTKATQNCTTSTPISMDIRTQEYQWTNAAGTVTREWRVYGRWTCDGFNFNHRPKFRSDYRTTEVELILHKDVNQDYECAGVTLYDDQGQQLSTSNGCKISYTLPASNVNYHATFKIRPTSQ